MKPFNYNNQDNSENYWNNNSNNNQQMWSNNNQGYSNVNNQDYNNYYNNNYNYNNMNNPYNNNPMDNQNYNGYNNNYNNGYCNQNMYGNNNGYYNPEYNPYEQNQYNQGQVLDKKSQKELKKRQKEEEKKRKMAMKTAKETKGLDVRYSYDDLAQYEDITYEDVTRPPKMINPKILTLCFLYMIFLTVGLFNTSFELGYKPQIINRTIKSNRVIFNKCEKVMNDLDKLEHFNGVSELNEVYENNSYQSRIPPLKSSLTKAKKYLEDLNTSSFKVKSDDYIKVEMITIVTDILNEEVKTLEKAIKHYELCTGYNPMSVEVQNSKSELLIQYDTYKKRMTNGKSRFNIIKQQELKLYN